MIDVSMRSLKDKLQVDKALLARAAQVWSLDHTALSSPSAIARLVERMRDPCIARSVWEQLSPPERSCLIQVVEASARRKGLPAERAMKKARLSPDEGAVIVARLIGHWCLIDEGEVLPNPTAANPRPAPVRTLYAYRESGETLERTGQELFKGYADRSTQSLDRLLSQFAWGDLEKLADLCHVPQHTTRTSYSSSSWSPVSHPSDLRSRIVQVMTHSPVVFELLHHLDLATQNLFVWLCTEQQAKAPMESVRAFLGDADEQVYAALRQLETHGLAFDSFSVDATRWLCVPQDLFAVIKDEILERAADEQTFALFPVATTPPTVRDGQPGICYDLATIIGYVHQHDLDQTKDGNLPRKASTRLRPLLHGMPRLRDLQGEVYVEQVFQLAQSMGLLRCASAYGEEKLRYQAGHNLSAWGERHLVEQVRLVLQEWIRSTGWYDVLPDGKLIYPIYNTTAVRETLLKHLRLCLPERYYRVDALFYAIWKQQPILLSTESSRYSGQVSQPTSLRTRREQWMQGGDGRLYMGLLTSALHEMGLVSLGYAYAANAAGATDQPVEWFSITPLGAAVLAEGPAVEGTQQDLWFMPGERPLIVQPSSEMLLLHPDMRVLYELICWSEIKRIGPVSTLHLTKHALLRGMAAGRSVEQVIDFLARHGRKDLPQNVAYTIIKDWSPAYKEARFAECILVDISSEQIEDDLNRLLAEGSIELRKLAPCTFAIFPHGTPLATLRRLLEKAGVVVREDPRAVAKRSSYR